MADSDDLSIHRLNPQQREAVDWGDGPLLLLAGAGTGKTRVIVARIVRLLSRGVAPESILAVTFTNKAAREMRDRVGELLDGGVAGRVTVATFHAFCCRLLREHIARLDYSPRFAIASDAYQSGLVRNIMAEMGYTGDDCDPGLWLALIGKAKSMLAEPEDVAAMSWPRAEDVSRVYAEYTKRMRLMDQLDFDDLLLLTYRLWSRNPDLLEQHRNRYRYLLIDEYQDTNALQFHLMATLAGPRRNLCVVGDDDQSIYGWRGADLGNILEFETRFPDAKVIRLEQNYRSTTTILDAANAVIARNSERHPKRLWSTVAGGTPILVVRTADEEAEAAFIAEFIEERRLRTHATWEHCAILFRANAQSRAIEGALRARRIPYTMVGSNSFYQRKEILDALSFLQVLANPRDDMSLLRILNVPPRGIGAATIERLRASARVLHRPVYEVLAGGAVLSDAAPETRQAASRLLDCFERHRRGIDSANALASRMETFLREVGYLDGLARMYKPREDALERRDNVLAFLAGMAEFAARNPLAGLREFLEARSLLDANDREEGSDRHARGVTLMTVHASKGLEFPLVLVAGLERGLFPHLRAMEDRTEAEERRLFYVAMTRARRELVLTHAEKRRRGARVTRQRPSGFLDDIPAELARFTTPEGVLTPVSADMAAAFIARMKAGLRPRPADTEPPASGESGPASETQREWF
ncbi:MAG: UvrD-helicase domain-containing protein [Lentisphaeria bacterium]|nr:UvrD-helicase domain-containing protein [Lentisphaeria bacterium]